MIYAVRWKQLGLLVTVMVFACRARCCCAFAWRSPLFHQITRSSRKWKPGYGSLFRHIIHWLRASRLNNPPILRVRLAGTFDLLYDGTAISLLLRLRLALARLFRPAIRILE
jgi:hypothetical protein